MKKIALIVALHFLMYPLFAQNVEFVAKNFPNDPTGFEKAMQDLDNGDRLFYQGPFLFRAALPHYLKAYEFNPNSADLNFKIGKIYKDMNKLHDAETYFIRALELDDNPVHRTEGEIALAELYHLEGEWDKAIEAYGLYKEFLKKVDIKKIHLFSRDLPHEYKYIDQRIRQCRNGKELTLDTVPILLENMGKGVNTEYPEYSAVVNGKEDLMVFTSRRPGSTGEKIPRGEVWQYEDIYFSRRDKNGWKNSIKIPGEVNTENHEAPVWMSADGSKLIIYRPTNNGDLYLTEFKDTAWTKPQPLPHINSSYRETHASMTQDGKTIYFTSDNPKYEKVHHGEKGFYNLDIYKIVFDEAKQDWSDPIQVEELNTEYDEECPFIEPDGKTMYFSSQGHTSIGGFDIFKTILEDGKFKEPVNVGYPINTPYNDIYIFFSQDGKRGYFDSDRREGLGEKDIYEMFILTAIRIPLQVRVFDADTKQPMNADVHFREAGHQHKMLAFTNPDKGIYETTVPVFKFFQVEAQYPDFKTFKGAFNSKVADVTTFDTLRFHYDIYLHADHDPMVLKGKLVDEKDGRLVPGKVEVIEHDKKVAEVVSKDGNYEVTLPRNKTYSFMVLAERYMPTQATFRLDTTKKNHDFVMKRLYVGDLFSMNHIYFKTGKSDIADSSITELELLLEFLNVNPHTTVEVGAHTDNVGSRQLNQRLSEKRARSVADWLIAHGVPKDRIRSKGYAFDKPIATNETAEGRSLNRRVEIKVLDDW